MKKTVFGLALLALVFCGPAAQACGYLCSEIRENCWGCVYTGDEFSGCRQVTSCHCQDEQCWAPSAALPSNPATATPEAFGIFAPQPNATPASSPGLSFLGQ